MEGGQRAWSTGFHMEVSEDRAVPQPGGNILWIHLRSRRASIGKQWQETAVLGTAGNLLSWATTRTVRSEWR